MDLSHASLFTMVFSVILGFMYRHAVSKSFWDFKFEHSTGKKYFTGAGSAFFYLHSSMFTICVSVNSSFARSIRQVEPNARTPCTTVNRTFKYTVEREYFPPSNTAAVNGGRFNSSNSIRLYNDSSGNDSLDNRLEKKQWQQL
jgi:hypothetical protein